MCYHFRDQTYLQNTCNVIKMITLLYIIIYHSHRCFWYIYISLKIIFPTCCSPQHLRIFQHCFNTSTMDTTEYWLMAQEYGIWNAAITALHFWAEDLDPVYPSHSFRACLHSFLLDFNQPHPTSVVWRSFIWMFCPCIKLSLPPAAVPSRWRLWKWFQWRLTNTLMAGSLHTSCFQYGTCIFQPYPFYTTLTSQCSSRWHTTIST